MATNTKTRSNFKFTYNMALMIIAILMFVTIGLFENKFFTANYIKETLIQVIEIGIMVLPSTLVIISGGIDFSMSAALIFSTIIGSIAASKVHPVFGLVSALIVGALCGLFNGVLIAKLKLPPLVTTLATMYLYKGFAEGLTMGIPAVGASVGSYSIATYLGTGKLLFIPTQIWVILMFAIIFHLLLSKTCFGRYVYAIGLNDLAAGFAGIKVDRIKIILYTIGGVMFSIAGLVFVGRFSSVRYDSADALTLQVITAVVLGGTSISGGVGNIKGSMLGVLIIGILKSGMNIMFVPQTQQKIFLGIILLISLMIFHVIGERAKKRIRIDYSTKKQLPTDRTIPLS